MEFYRVIDAQAAPAVSTAGDALQQCGTFADGAACLVRFWVDVAVDAHLIGLECLPINKPGMMFWQEYSPLGDGQVADSLLDGPMFIEIALATSLAVNVGAGVDGISEHAMNSSVSGRDPADIANRVPL